MEIWKSITGYEGLYQVSNLGNVKSLERQHRSGFNGNGITKRKERLLKKVKDKDGYLCVSLSKESKVKTMKVHRLVALAFVPNPDNKNQVNHKDALKYNNIYSNLEWNTNKENINHAILKGLIKRNPNIESNRLNGMKTAKRIKAFCCLSNKLVWECQSITSASIKYNIDKRSIQRNLKGENKKVKGLYFKSY